MRENAGFEIIANCPLAADGEEIVMGRRTLPDGEHDPTPFVTWLCCRGDSYMWGHYIADADAAREDFVSRINRGY